MYEIVFSKEADALFGKLEKQVQARVVSALERIRVSPEKYVKKLVGNPFYRLRVGDYRVILGIQRNKLIILVITLGHRKNIYKRL